MRFSYPGYAELMTGTPHDAVMDSNNNRRYPFETVLQFLRREFGATREQVACFGSWDVFTSISASLGGEVFTNAGYQEYDVPEPRMQALSAAQFETCRHGTGPATIITRGSSRSIISCAISHARCGSGSTKRTTGPTMEATCECIEYLHRFDGWLAELWR